MLNVTIYFQHAVADKHITQSINSHKLQLYTNLYTNYMLYSENIFKHYLHRITYLYLHKRVHVVLFMYYISHALNSKHRSSHTYALFSYGREQLIQRFSGITKLLFHRVYRYVGGVVNPCFTVVTKLSNENLTSFLLIFFSHVRCCE